MGLFDKLMGRSGRVQEVQVDGGKLRVDASGKPVFDASQTIAFRLAKEFRSEITEADVGSPYGYGLGVEPDVQRLRSACLNDDGVMAEVEVRAPMPASNLINLGRFTTDDLLATMGLRRDGSSLTDAFEPGSANDEFSQLTAGLLREAPGFGGTPGPHVDRYSADPDLRVVVTAWHLRALARLDAEGRTTVPDL